MHFVFYRLSQSLQHLKRLEILRGNMDALALINCLYAVLMVLLASYKVKTIAGECMIGHAFKRLYSNTIENYTIVGPIMSTITTEDQSECEKECHLAVLDLCYMFNYHPSSKVCELLYKDRAAEYKLERKPGSTFTTRKCLSSPCLIGEQCVSLGNQNNVSCLHTSAFTKLNDAPVCIGAKGNAYGQVFAPADGQIRIFKLVHISGGVSVNDPKRQGKWGTLTETGLPSHLEIIITDRDDYVKTPPPGYPVNNADGHWRYDVPGFNNMSPEFVLPEISPPLTVTKGEQLKVWYGEDFSNKGDDDNTGTVCADVYVL